MELEWERREGQRWKEGERVKCGCSSRPSWADETSEMEGRGRLTELRSPSEMELQVASEVGRKGRMELAGPQVWTPDRACF